MRYIIQLFVIVAIVLSLVPGCSGKGDSNPTVPGSDPVIQQDEGQSVGSAVNRWVWGLWDVTIPADHSTVEVAPVRIAAMHLNVVRLIEVNPCHDCLRIGNITPVAPNTIEVDVTLVHPFPGLDKYTGFDVRGIFISEGNFTFPSSGRMIALGDDVPTVLNADGYTSLFNPIEFPPSAPPALGYIPGKYATGGDLTSTLNPFLAYRRDAPRRMFEAGGSETRTFRLHAPPGPIHFGYAVDASWQLVQGEITDPLVDFPPDANCLEAYKICLEFPCGINSAWMSENNVNVEVSDHQGIGTISNVSIEAPGLFAGEMDLTLSTQTGEDSWLFNGLIINENGGDGSLPILARVTDTETDQNYSAIQGWDVGKADMGVESEAGWARTWGGIGCDKVCGVAVDGAGNVYVTGSFDDVVDFDPGSGTDFHTSNGYSDIFLSKFDSCGQFNWARTWGGSTLADDLGLSVAVDESGNAYVTGVFCGLVDFDPGSGVDEHESRGPDVFLSKFDGDGTFMWVRAWGGSVSNMLPIYDIGHDVAVDESSHVYVAGHFEGIADFDPGSGEDYHEAVGVQDIFVTKFDSNGTFDWARTWGGRDWPMTDSGYGVCVDGAGNVYVTGYYSQTADFDPGSDEDYHTAEDIDAFLSKFDSLGEFIWARTWGSSGYDMGYDVGIDGAGSVYVTGSFKGDVDFDAGSGEDNHSSNGSDDAYLSKLDSTGQFEWARTWGSLAQDKALGIGVDGEGNAYVTGYFYNIVDLDPGNGVDEYESNGGADVFLSCFDRIGAFSWALTWGGIDFSHNIDIGYDCTCDESGDVYVIGHFGSTADFDPGQGSDYHASNGDLDAFLSKFLSDGTW